MDYPYFRRASATMLATAVTALPIPSVVQELAEGPSMFKEQYVSLSNRNVTGSAFKALFTSIFQAQRSKSNLELSNTWLSQNRNNYRGKWVVLVGDTLIGADEHPKALVDKARKEGVEAPFVTFIEEGTGPVWFGSQ